MKYFKYQKKIEVEYRFEYNGSKTADIAYLDNNKILYIFEINVTDFINKVNDNCLINLQIAYIRDIKLILTKNIKYEDVNYDIFKKIT